AEKLTTISNKQITINFPSGSSQLDSNAQYIIEDKFGPLVQGFADARVKIEGNTDNQGSQDLNVRLSQARAQSVMRYLVGKYHIDQNRFIVRGNGYNKPVADNETEEGRSKNRRTDFQ